MSTIFTKIISGEISSYKIAEDENYLAFLDIFPLSKGHTIVIPKKEVDFIYDLDDETLSGLNIFAKKVAKAIQKSIECKRIGIMVVGVEVPHAHIHLIPFNSPDEMNMKNPKLKFSDAEFKEFAKLIIQKL